MIPSSKLRDKLKLAEQANLINDQARMFKSDQARTDHYFKTMAGVPIPDEEMIDLSEKTIYNSSGTSPLMAAVVGLLAGALPLAVLVGTLLNKAPAVVQQMEKVVEKPVEKVIELPGKSYGVDVDVEVIPPPDK